MPPPKKQSKIGEGAAMVGTYVEGTDVEDDGMDVEGTDVEGTDVEDDGTDVEGTDEEDDKGAAAEDDKGAAAEDDKGAATEKRNGEFEDLLSTRFPPGMTVDQFAAELERYGEFITD